jgi:Methyltransferase domain
MSPTSRAEVVQAVKDLSQTWHGAGSVSHDLLDALVDLCPPEGWQETAETGCGRTTLLFSHLSAMHTAFTLDDGGSLTNVQNSPLLRAGHTRIVAGPSQQTLPAHQFPAKLDLAMIDGAHGFPFPDLDYYYFYPQLKPGGLLLVDDFHIPSIGRLCEFITDDDMFEHVANISFYTAVFRRTDAETFDPLGDGWWLQRFNKKRFPNPEHLESNLGPEWWIK